MTPFDQSLPMMLYRALDRVMPHYRELFAEHDLTEQQWRVLRIVWRNDNVTSADLSEHTLLAAPSLVGIIDRLEKKHLVARVRSVDDRRQIFVVATEQGRKLQQRILPRLEKIQSTVKGRVSDEEWQSLQRILTKISQNAESSPSLNKKAETA